MFVSSARSMNLEALWHDLECGPYGEDLPLWRALARDAGGAVLDVGAGTGRVSLSLAGEGIPVVALDFEPMLLEALTHRATGLPVETVVADARAFDVDQRFSLIVLPMQTLQLFGGRSGRAAFLRGALRHLEPGGVVAAAVADALDCFDDVHPLPPPPEVCDIGEVRYATTLLAVVDEGEQAMLRRRREIVGPGKRYEAEDVALRLDRVSPSEIRAEAAELGFGIEPDRLVPETEEYLGSTVIVMRAP